MRWHDLLQRKLLQMRHGVGNQPLHRCTRQMQAAEDSVQWYICKHLAGIQQDIDDAGMRARTEDDEPLPLHVDRHIAFVQDQGVRLPWLIHGPFAEMIRPAFFEARYPGYFAAQVKAVIYEQAWVTTIDHLRAVRCECLR